MDNFKDPILDDNKHLNPWFQLPEKKEDKSRNLEKALLLTQITVTACALMAAVTDSIKNQNIYPLDSFAIDIPSTANMLLWSSIMAYVWKNSIVSANHKFWVTAIFFTAFAYQTVNNTLIREDAIQKYIQATSIWQINRNGLNLDQLNNINQILLGSDNALLKYGISERSEYDRLEMVNEIEEIIEARAANQQE